MGEDLRLAFRRLFRKKGRTVLTVIGIAVGVMMVALVTVLGQTATAALDNELEKMGVNGLSVTAEEGNLLDERALSRIRELPSVSSAMPLILQYADITLLSRQQEAVLCGIDAGADQVISLSLKYGRLIGDDDVRFEKNVCVLDEAVAVSAYGRGNIVGKTVRVKAGNGWKDLTVVGITETGSSLLQSVTAFLPAMVYLPYTTEQALTGTETFDQIAVRTEDSNAGKRISSLLFRLYEGQGTFRTDDLAMQKGRLDRVVSGAKWVLTGISGVSLLVSGCGIMTAMLCAVSEQKKEIGIKKAIGASRGRILTEFLAESALLGLVGGMIGLIPALLLCPILSAFGFPAAVPVRGFLGLLAFSVAVGAVFGGYPAYKAASLSPAQALRGE